MRTPRQIALALLVVVLAGVAAIGLYSWGHGYRAYVVHTGSMMPTLNPGDLVIDKPATHLAAGEIITFRHSRLSTDVVTHRITNVRDGYIDTKGDANRTPDVWKISPDQVQGTVASTFARFGYAVVFLKQPSGIGGVMTGTLALLLLWGLFFPPRDTPATAARCAAR